MEVCLSLITKFPEVGILGPAQQLHELIGTQPLSVFQLYHPSYIVLLMSDLILAASWSQMAGTP